MAEAFDPAHDLRLVRDVAAGRGAAVDELVERMRVVPRMLALQNVRLGRPLDDHELADLAQDVVLVVLRKLGSYAGASPLEAWMCRIASLELRNAARRKRYRPVPVADLPPQEARGPVDDFDDLHRGLDRLPDDEAAVVRLKHFEDCTFQEIGTRLDIPVNTAKSRYYRALSQLERTLASTRQEDLRERPSPR